MTPSKDMLFPAEITTDVLSRLPVKSLKRSRCVSKSWWKEIDSPYFITEHLKKSSLAHTHLSLILRGRDDTKLYTVDLDEPNPTSTELFESDKDKDVEVMGSCNGLLALLSSDKTMALYNPCTREHKILPFSPVELHTPSGKNYAEACTESHFYGFGYDPINEDYKIVKIIAYYGDTVDGCFFPEVKVYSLKSNSWKRILGYPYYSILQPEYHPPTERAYGVFANSAVHWAASDTIGEGIPPNLIVAFDFGVEGFRIIPQPDYLDNDRDYFDVGVLGGCLCLLCTKKGFQVQIWVMKEYGVESSWTKLCTVISQLQVDPFCFYVRPLAYSKSEDKVLLEWDNRFFVWYDLRSRKSKIVKIDGAPEMFTAEIFVGSLVKLNSDGGGEMIGSRVASEKGDQEEKKIRHTVGNGENIFLWRDQWHPHGPLVKYYDTRIMSDTGLTTNAKLEVIRNEDWHWHASRSNDMEIIQSATCELIHTYPLIKDCDLDRVFGRF